MKKGLTSTEKKVYNAVFTGLSIGLGLNLATSVKRYAQIMRWRFLASTYRTLETFELIMQSESQVNLCKLIWVARSRGQWWPNSLQVLVLAWVFINAGLQVLTALLGLTFEFTVSPDQIHMVSDGNVSIPFLSEVSLYNPSAGERALSFASQAVNAQSFGAQSIAYPSYDNSSITDFGLGTQQYYYNPAGTSYW